MAGNERAGENGWDSDLFRNALFFICPGKYSRPADLMAIKRILRALKTQPLVIHPAKHDQFVALSSHLPAFLSVLYRRFSRSLPAEFQGPGYRSVTRLAQTSPELLRTFLESNGDNIERLWQKWIAMRANFAK